LIEFEFIKPANLAKRFVPDEWTIKDVVLSFLKEIEEFNEIIILGTLAAFAILILSIGACIK